MWNEAFENLEFYKDSRSFYGLPTNWLLCCQTSQRYNLADQLRRAATSILLNIAEGYGRFHYLDRLRFLYIARGSLNETLSAVYHCE